MAYYRLKLNVFAPFYEESNSSSSCCIKQMKAGIRESMKWSVQKIMKKHLFGGKKNIKEHLKISVSELPTCPVGFSCRSLFHRSLNVLSFEKYKIKLIRVFLALMAMQGGIVHFHAQLVLLYPVMSVHILSAWPFRVYLEVH